jgi:surface antigen
MRSAASRGLAPAVLAAASLLAGCAGGFDLGRLDTDRSIVTNSVGSPTGQQPDSRVSDEAAIRATVAAWDAGEAAPKTVPWVNANTGSSGAITRLAEARGEGRRCRTFTVSRDSFAGSSRYDGRACLDAGGSWIVTELNQG